MGYVLANTVSTIINIFFWLVLIRVIFSWIRPGGQNRLLAEVQQVVYTLTEPILAPIRNLLPTTMGLDFSPIIAIILLNVLEGLARPLILQIFGL